MLRGTSSRLPPPPPPFPDELAARPLTVWPHPSPLAQNSNASALGGQPSFVLVLFCPASSTARQCALARLAASRSASKFYLLWALPSTCGFFVHDMRCRWLLPAVAAYEPAAARLHGNRLARSCLLFDSIPLAAGAYIANQVTIFSISPLLALFFCAAILLAISHR